MPELSRLLNSPVLTAQALPSNRARAEIGWEKWRDLEKAAAANSAGPSAKMGGDDIVYKILDPVFGCSPFLTQCAISHPALIHAYAELGPDKVAASLVAELESLLDAPPKTDEAGRELRLIRQRVALLCGIADMTKAWPLEKVTGMLSALADLAAEVALRAHWAEAADRNQIEMPPGFPSLEQSGYVLLGMGKLGAHELNYSSDIDLIALYDPERVPVRDEDKLRQRMIRLTQGMVDMLSARTRFGYVFRTDLRLRPDPGSTPLAISLPAAEYYYESAGQNWERAAFIKARPIAGSRETGLAFLEMLRPFVWRRNLDFASIQDIHSIKRQINAHRGGGTIAVPGHNIKLGRGGIREIEFFAQTQQLIFGGRQPDLRVPGTLGALDALVAAERIDARTRDDLAAAYRFLRTVEHRLQMIEDQQTHSLPDSDEALTELARFLGYEDGEPFVGDMEECLRLVERHYADLFEEAPSLSAAGNLVFTGDENDPETMNTLTSLGFTNPEAVAEIIRRLHRGRYRATRTQRARQLLTEMTPTLLEKFGNTADPDQAFTRFDQFLGGLPAGIQIFSLLHANPSLLDLLAEIMGTAPRLARTLGRMPQLLDAVLLGDEADETLSREALLDDLSGTLRLADDYELVLDAVRRWVHDHEFRIGVAQLRGILDAETAGAARSRVAEAAMEALLPRVAAQFATKHGKIDGARFSIFGLGKIGSGELSSSSDLDLVFVYDAPEGATQSDGDRPLATSHYFARFAQRVFDALTAPTSEGPLYEIDMRLRPAGNTGPLASSRQAFTDYQENKAWTWEHMALTRARFLAGDAGLGEEMSGFIRGVLARERNQDTLLRDVASMRERMAKEHSDANIWNIKHVRGGLVDIEFTAQYLQLRFAPENPDILSNSTSVTFERLAEAGLLDRREAERLAAATRFWLNLQAMKRLTVEGTLVDEAIVPALRIALARAVGADNFDVLKRRMAETREIVLDAYEKWIGEPAAALPPVED